MGRILVIDDDQMVLDVMKQELIRHGWDVLTATNGSDGLSLARENHPSIVILDALMPGMNGWTVLSEFKRDPVISNIPVIMVSVVDNKSLGFAFGVTDYLTKPVRFNDLVMILKRYGCSPSSDPILVVEDEVTTRKLITESLRTAGWRVDEAENGKKALHCLDKNRPAMILLDLLMPVMDGFEFLTELRKREDGKEVPVVVLTAMNLTDRDHDRLKGSVEQVLQKHNYNIRQFVEEVRNVAAGFRR